MAKQVIDIGTVADDGTGDSLRTGMDKCNDNFTELYAADLLLAPLASPTFTGTVSGITKAMVGLTNVDDTADTDKPISTATQAALDLKATKLSSVTKRAGEISNPVFCTHF